MIAFIIYMIDAWLDKAEQKRREAYLADAKDLDEVERRIRALENGDVLR